MTIGRIPSVEGGIQPTIVDAKGDLIAATAADTVNRLAVGSNDQVLVADSSTSTGLAWKSYGAQFVAGKNKIINGDFRINQRSFSSQALSTEAAVYTFDRFYFQNVVGGTTTCSAQTFTAGTAPVAGYEGVNFIRLASTGQTNSSAGSFIAQPIEDVRTFAGQTVTLSFWAKASSGTPKVGMDLRQQFGSGGSAAVEKAASVTISTSWTRYSQTFTLDSVSGKTIGTGSALNVELWTSAGSDFNSRTGSIGIQTTTIDFWGVQVEAGSVATAFQTATGTLAGELAACQRYYQKSFAQATAPANDTTGPTAGGATGWIAYNADNVRSPFIVFPVTMRTSASVTLYNTTDITDDGYWAYYTGSAWAKAASALGQQTVTASESGFYVSGNNVGAYTQHRPYLLAGNWAASAEL